MKLATPSAALAAVVALSLVGCSAGGAEASDGESRTLTMATPISEQSVQGQSVAAWIEAVEEATDGSIQIEVHSSGSLLAGTDILPGLVDGRADLGMSYSNYHSTDLPYWNVVAYPFVTPSWHVFAETFQQLEDEFPEIEQAWSDFGVVPLADITNGAAGSATSEELASFSALNGKRFRAPGLMASVAAEAGVESVFMELSEMYEALQRGVLDGWIGTEFGAAVALNVQEVTPHFVDYGIGQYSGARIFANPEVWESLTPEQQSAIETVSADYPSALIPLVTEIEAEACDAVLDAGGTVTIADQGDAEYQAWRESALEVARATLVENAEAAGIAPAEYEAVIDRYIELAAETSASIGDDYVDGLALCAER
ncbi:TRAP transporter substrate-binding protein DctP [Agrococcus sp. TSP3-2-1]|uniref:TRAP transporter substrate-binding protein DctP n=1 Tax=Agrococcus sp. TSP3-2-1 TaxID=2804583 RepID=UPI003CE711B2